MLHILKGKKTVFCLRNSLLLDEKIKPLDRNFLWFSPQTYLQKQSSLPPSSLPHVKWFLLIASFKVLGFSCSPIDSPVTDPFSPLRVCAYTALPCFCIFLPHRLILLVLVTSGLLRQVTTLSVRTSSLWNSLHWHSSGTLISTPTFLQHWSC